MRGRLSGVYWFWCLVYVGWLSPVWGVSCPWQEEGLQLWSASNTWGDEGVPGDDSEVVIPAGQRVVLDVQPAPVSSVKIEAGAALVWGDVDGLTLDTRYIWVNGEFHIGSQDCRFNKSARIRLHGLSNDDFEVADHEFGRKFIGVAPKATLELHGKRKTSWTKLAQTVRPIRDIECAYVYDDEKYDLKNNKAGVSNQQGLNVMVWNEDGSFMDFTAFKSYNNFPDFFDTIPDGKIIGMYAYGSNGIGTATSTLKDMIVSLGSSLINDINKKQGYSFLGIKGGNTPQEVIRSDNEDVSEERLHFLQIPDIQRGIVFQVAANLYSVKEGRMFSVLNYAVAFPKLTLRDEVEGWEEGDEVLLTSTDYEWRQAEVRRIMKCPDCSARQIRVDEPLIHMHYGNFTYNVDERGEVAILSRGIVIEGVMESTCKERTSDEKDDKFCKIFNRDMFGGHLKVMRGFTSVHIRGVKLLHMGQQGKMGKYPVHFHMCDDVEGTYVRETTVMDSRQRCFTVHGTNKLEVSDNVCYLHHGHGLFLEDACEQENLISGNLILGTKHGTLLFTDRKKEWCKKSQQDYCNAVSTYWLTHPNNKIINNVAAGSDKFGFAYMFADLPLGPSRERQRELNRTHHPKDMPIFFKGNVAHSNEDTGMHMDERISTGTGIEGKGMIIENAILRFENEYDPHINGTPVWVEMDRSTFYKNWNENMWIKGGNIRVSYSALADSKRGFTGGTTLTESGTEVYKTIFIGETDNTGEPSRRNVDGKLLQFERSYRGIVNDSVTAISAYQGPNFIRSCYFDQYNDKSWCLQENTALSDCPEDKIIKRVTGAISFKRSSIYPTLTSSYAINNTFGFCDNENNSHHWVFQAGPDIWKWRDGNRGVFLRDKDGALTGTYNASIVANFPLYRGDECQLRTDWGDLLVCPYRYIKMEILGEGGSLSSNKKKQWPLIIQRDDSPYNVPFHHKGEIRNEFLLRTHRSYILDFNTSLDGAEFPSEIRVFGYGVEKGDVVRVGICQPKDVKGFDIMMHYPVFIKHTNATWVNSLADLDSDTTGAAFFHDKENGMLFFKILSFHKDTNETQRCPDGHCWKVQIRPEGGTRTKMRTCGGKVSIDSFQDNTEKPSVPRTSKCPGIGSPEGLGPVDWANVGFIEHNEFSVPCRDLPAPTGSEHQGCWKEKYGKTKQDLKANEELYYHQSMTVEYCVHRCTYRNYAYAGLSRGTRCTCSNIWHNSTDFQASNCNKNCEGNTTQSCGGSSSIDVWSTGL